MTPLDAYKDTVTRRYFFKQGSHALGWAALSSLLGRGAGSSLFAAESSGPKAAAKKTLQHFAGKAKNVIYLHMVGGPSQIDTYDYKPVMDQFYDKDLPETVRNGQRLTTMTSGQARFP